MRCALLLLLLIQKGINPLLYLGFEQWISWLNILAKQSIVFSNVVILRLVRNLARLIAVVVFGGLLHTLVFDQAARVVAFQDRSGYQKILDVVSVQAF